MGLKEDKTITDIVQAVRESDAKKTKGYDTQATVVRVEDGKAWVHIPGGVPETPVELTINAQPGDSVMVRLAGGRAFLIGNATSPPTDDATAKEALSNAADALQSAVNAKLAADSAEASAATASAAAQDAVETAEAVHDIAVQAQEDAETAKTNAQTAIENAAAAQSAAGAAQTSANNAQAQAASATASANGALNGLSTVQDVIGVLDWAKDNATYTLTSDPDIVPGKTYWTRSGSGTSADPYVYTPVVTPVKADLGTYYEISGVDEAMADYINTHLALTDEGLYVMADGSAWKVLISDDGVYILDPTGVPANQMTGNGNIVGYVGETHVEIDYHSLQLIARGEITPYFWVSDLRDKDDNYQATITETFTADGATRTFRVQLDVSAEVSATDDSHSSNTATRSGKDYTFATRPSNGATVTIVYKTTSELAKAYTFGRRESGYVGAMSIAEGYDTTASGYASHAEGESEAIGNLSHSEGRGRAVGKVSHAEGNGRAEGNFTHAEGNGTRAISDYSHVEGYNTLAYTGEASHAEGKSTEAIGEASHAEGYDTEARGDYSHAEGGYTKAIGRSSHAQNEDTIAGYDYQTAIGKYNDNQSGNAFEIGNGTDDNDRSNAFSVDWDGEMRPCLNNYQTTGNVDKTIYDALNSLGWLSDCVES